MGLNIVEQEYLQGWDGLKIFYIPGRSLLHIKKQILKIIFYNVMPKRMLVYHVCPTMLISKVYG